MNKIFIGTALAAGLMATGTAQADTEDALLGGLFGVALGVAIADDDHRHHRHVTHHYYRPYPVRHIYYAPPRHHHPRGHAYGYWRKHDGRKHHQVRHDWDRRDRRHGDRRWRRRD